MARQKTTGEILGAEDELGSVLFVLFIPSKTKDGKNLPAGQDQQMWADAIGDTLTDLFGGCTQMPVARGKWRNENSVIITEDVILLHSYASQKDAENEEKLHQLAVHLHRMGKALHQGEVGLVIDGVFYKIRKFVLADSRTSK